MTDWLQLCVSAHAHAADSFCVLRVVVRCALSVVMAGGTYFAVQYTSHVVMRFHHLRVPANLSYILQLNNKCPSNTAAIAHGTPQWCCTPHASTSIMCAHGQHTQTCKQLSGQHLLTRQNNNITKDAGVVKVNRQHVLTQWEVYTGPLSAGCTTSPAVSHRTEPFTPCTASFSRH